MSWSTTSRRFWWLLPIGLGLLGMLHLARSARRTPQPPVAPAPVRPTPRAIPRVRGVVSSPLGSEEHMVVMADFNGDGYLVAHANENYGESNADPQGTVSLWFGDGHGGLRHRPVLRDADVVTPSALSKTESLGYFVFSRSMLSF